MRIHAVECCVTCCYGFPTEFHFLCGWLSSYALRTHLLSHPNMKRRRLLNVRSCERPRCRVNTRRYFSQFHCSERHLRRLVLLRHRRRDYAAADQRTCSHRSNHTQCWSLINGSRCSTYFLSHTTFELSKMLFLITDGRCIRTQGCAVYIHTWLIPLHEYIKQIEKHTQCKTCVCIYLTALVKQNQCFRYLCSTVARVCYTCVWSPHRLGQIRRVEYVQRKFTKPPGL